MHLPSSPLAHLILAASLLALPAQEPKKWAPFFDYTNVPAATEDMWAQIGQVPVQFEQALEVARQSEGELRLISARQESTPRGSVWSLQLFVVGAEETPKRVDLEVSTEAPKIVHRLDFLALAPGEAELWNVLKAVRASPADACASAHQCIVGKLPEPQVKVVLTRGVVFRIDLNPPIWDVELIGVDLKDQPQRWAVQMKVGGGAKQRLLLDRFAGEPLRGAKPTELRNGLILHDFVPGDGETITTESKVKVNYRLFLLDGSVVYSTTEKKRPETFLVSNAPLKGMTEGMVGMRVGCRRKIVIPFDRAFGEQGTNLAPPRATVVCDISIEELLTE